MDYHTKKDIAKARNVLIDSNDPRFNYTFHQAEDIDGILENQEFILTMDKYDYGIVKQEADEYNLAKITPCSLAQIETLEDAEFWYQQKFPTMPNEYWGIMARYSFGELLTKKEIKNKIKKYKKKNQEPPVGLQLNQGPFKLEFS